MSFVEGGITFQEPTDKAIVSYDGGKYVLISYGDSIQRVKMSEFAASQEGGGAQYLLYPFGSPYVSGVYVMLPGAVRYRLNGAGSLFHLSSDQNGGRIYIQSNGWTYIGEHLVSDGNIGAGGTVSGWRVALPNVSGIGGTGIAYNWNTYACSLADKEQVQIIQNAVETCKRMDGITYIQNGSPGAGIPAEHLELSGIPDTYTKDANGKYTSVNKTNAIPLMLQAIKELAARLEAVEAQK